MLTSRHSPIPTAFGPSALAHAILALTLLHLAHEPQAKPIAPESVPIYAAAPKLGRLHGLRRVPPRTPRRVLPIPEVRPREHEMLPLPEMPVLSEPIRVKLPEELPFPAAGIEPAPAPENRSDVFAKAPVTATVRRGESFDRPSAAKLPAGSGVASAAGGFAAAKMANERHGNGGMVRSGAFGTPETMRAPAPRESPAPAVAFGSMQIRSAATGSADPPGGKTVELEILDKPRPEYSPEARQLKVEGVVVLEISFGANGQVRVLRVLQRLGHGLDENAVRAATGIRFHPALEHGRPVDTVASVRIEFQLAY